MSYAAEIDEISFDAENLVDIEDMVSVCGGLATYNERSHIISLVHYTTQEYFDRERFPWSQMLTPTLVIHVLHTSATMRLHQGHARHYASLNRKLDNILYMSLQQQAWATTDLHLAASLGLDEELEALVNGNYQVDSLDGYGNSPLSVAVEAGHETTVKFLLAKGTDPHVQVKFYSTLLLLATMSNRETLVELFLDLASDPQTRNKTDRSPLSYAAENGHEGVTELLLHKHAERDATDRF